MNVFADHPRARWAVPTGVLACIAVGGMVANQAASATASLPPRTAAQLLVDVQKARLSGLSGTVVQTSNLGLPDLPGVSSSSGLGGGSSSLTSMVAGTHTWRVWYAGQDKARIALLGNLGESDVVRNGRDLWVWSSKDKTATHTVLDQGKRGIKPSPTEPTPTELPVTPQAAADQALAALDPTTAVTTSGSAKIDGHDAYELVLTPKRDAQGKATTLVAQVRIAVDADHHVPLRVRIYSTRSANPAFEVSFSQVDFAKPDASTFSFNPPPGTTVTQSTPSSQGPAMPKATGIAPAQGAARAKADAAAKGVRSSTKVVGHGWSTVVVGTVPAQLDSLSSLGGPPAGPKGAAPSQTTRASRQLAALLHNLPRISGPWGSGRLLNGTLFSVLLTDDGRFAVGAVPPAQLIAALSAK